MDSKEKENKKIFVKVPQELFDKIIRQIYNSTGHIGQNIQLITLLQKCEKIEE